MKNKAIKTNSLKISADLLKLTSVLFFGNRAPDIKGSDNYRENLRPPAGGYELNVALIQGRIYTILKILVKSFTLQKRETDEFNRKY